MNSKKTSPDFGLMAIAGILVPAIMIFAITFIIAPAMWPGSENEIGNKLGFLFMIYLIIFAIRAARIKIRKEKIIAKEEANDIHKQ